MGLPNIVVQFLTAASTAITRSERGIACVVIADATKTNKVYTFNSISDVDAADWTAENYQLIKDALYDGCYKLHVVRAGASEQWANIAAELDKLKINWLCHVNATQTDVISYVKARNANKRISAPIKAVVYNGTAPDDIHIVNFCNTAAVRADGTTVNGYKMLPRLAGMLAATPLDKSCTYYQLNDFKSVTEVADMDTAVEAGKFILFNDFGTVKVARGVNSSTTAAADQKKIAVVEGMDLMREDIVETFKANYVGKYKNSLDNQSIFVAACNTYFRALAGDGVLNPDFENLAEIDIESQRRALVNSGKTEALDWSDDEIKKHPYLSSVFVKANVMFMDAMEDLVFSVYMD